ncbi:rho GTPase-activating protein 11A [Pelodytes ibericus]
MSPDYQSLARLAVTQHLRSYGIKIKHWNKQRPDTGRGPPGATHSCKVFGAPLHALPQVYVEDYGNIPGFLVHICKHLEHHAHTEGLFRKSGSVARQKLLKAKLESGDSCLLEAPACDVAGILKQFFRELPEPILPTDLQDALYKAQQLASGEERTSATMLISCLIPERTIPILRYFFTFLHAVSMRSDANRMDSSNLAVIFAPNLLHSNDDNEKISTSTEKKLRVQVALVRTLIDQAQDIGCVPSFLLEKIPGMLGVDGRAGTPGPDTSEDGELDSLGEKKRRRRSVGDFVSGALNKLVTNRTPTCTPQTERMGFGSMITPLILTPSTKRKLPVDSGPGFSSKKRKSIKNSLTFELLPNSLFGSGSTPVTARHSESPCTSFESSQNVLSPSVNSGKRLSNSGILRRSKRCENRKVQRVESGKTGCFSPRISRKEMVRRSLRLRFSLGKSSKDVVSHWVFPSNLQSQNIGWRLANSQELTPVTGNTKVEPLSCAAESPFVSAGSKKISKSEENLLTPKLSEDSSHRLSWTGPQPCKLETMCDEDTPVSGCLWAANCYSEPVLVSGKPPAMPKEPRPLKEIYRPEQKLKDDSLCEESSLVEKTLLKITKAFTESGSDLHKMMTGLTDSKSVCALEIGNVSERREEKIIVGRRHVEATTVRSDETSVSGSTENSWVGDHADTILMIEEQEEVPTNLTEWKLCHQACGREVVRLDLSNVCDESITGSSEQEEDAVEIQQDVALPCQQKVSFRSVDSREPLEDSTQECSTVRRSTRVSDHIQHFNKLCLSDRGSLQMQKSPIKFQRTPVRHSVRRINSLSEMKRQVTNAKQSTTSLTMMKSVSCDGSLSSEISLMHPDCTALSACTRKASVSQITPASHSEIRSKNAKQSLRMNARCVPVSVNPKSVLEDLTNQHISKSSTKKPELSTNTASNSAVLLVSGRERHRYRGSPKNPIAKVNFLPSMKPLEL